MGKKLTKEFKKIYGTSTRFVVPIISKYYPDKDWTDFEFSVVKKEKGRRNVEFVLPLRLDKTKILGLHEDVGYLNLQRMSIKDAAVILLAKIGLQLVIRPEWWAVGYAVNLPDFIDEWKPNQISKEDWSEVESVKVELFARLRDYLNSTGVEYRLWRDLAEEDKNIDLNDSLGVWVLLHWDPVSTPLPLHSHGHWELAEVDKYERIFGKDEPDEDEGE